MTTPNSPVIEEKKTYFFDKGQKPLELTSAKEQVASLTSKDTEGSNDSIQDSSEEQDKYLTLQNTR